MSIRSDGIDRPEPVSLPPELTSKEPSLMSLRELPAPNLHPQAASAEVVHRNMEEHGVSIPEEFRPALGFTHELKDNIGRVIATTTIAKEIISHWKPEEEEQLNLQLENMIEQMRHQASDFPFHLE